MRGVQPRKGLCRDVGPTTGVAEALSHGYEQLSSEARSRTVLRVPAPLCQNSCFFWPWLTLAVVLKFKRLPTDKVHLLFHWPGRIFPYQFIFCLDPNLIC